MKIGQRIKEIRKLRQITQRRLSSMTHISKSYLCDIEKQKRNNIGIDKLKSIADALAVSINDLIDETTLQLSDELTLIYLYRQLKESDKYSILVIIRAWIESNDKNRDTK